MNMTEEHTLNANFSSPSVNPGRCSNLVPALAITATVVVGPGRSLLAYLTPEASPVSYEKLPEAAAARQRLLEGAAKHCWRRLCCALRHSTPRDIILNRAIQSGTERDRIGNGRIERFDFIWLRGG